MSAKRIRSAISSSDGMLDVRLLLGGALMVRETCSKLRATASRMLWSLIADVKLADQTVSR